MGDLLNYTSDNNTIVELLENGIHFSPLLLRDFNIKKGEKFPVISQSANPKVFMLSWGLHSPVSVDGDDRMKLTHIYAASIMKQQTLKKMLLNNRIIIPVNTFVHQDKGGQDIIIKHKHNKILFMAGMWKEKENGDFGFAILTHDVSDRNGNAHFVKRLPVFIDSKEAIKKWLKPDTRIFDCFQSLIATEISYDIKQAGELV